jgi:hypothetical protein
MLFIDPLPEVRQRKSTQETYFSFSFSWMYKLSCAASRRVKESLGEIDQLAISQLLPVGNE